MTVQAQSSDLSQSQSVASPVPADYVPAAESGHELYHVQLGAFEGPLDLLSFLIRRHKIDIFDIPIAFICGKYLEYLRLMEDLNVDVAAGFMYTASELVHIKSKLLLPKPVEIEDDAEEGDPRAELVRRLLDYQRYKVAAADLDHLDRLGRDVFERPAEPLPPAPDGTRLREVSVFALVEAFGEVLKRQKPEVRHRVVMEEISVRQTMMRMIDVLADQATVAFSETIGAAADRLSIIGALLAVLELTRMQLLRIYESEAGNLYLKARFDDVDEAISKLRSNTEMDYAG